MTISEDAQRQSADPAGEGGLDIKELLGILRRRKKVILSTVLLLTSLAVLAGLQLTPKYTATAMVMIDPRKSTVVDVEAVIQGLGTDASTVESQIRLISSRFQLERLATRSGHLRRSRNSMSPCATPTATSSCRWPGRSRSSSPGCRIPGWSRPDWRRSRSRPPRSTSPICSTKRRSRSSPRASRSTPEGRSYVIRIAFTSESAKKAANVVNAAANRYVDMLREEKVGKTELATEWLAQRLDELRREVEVAEGAVEEYRAKNNINDVNGITLNEQRLFDVNQRLSALARRLCRGPGQGVPDPRHADQRLRRHRGGARGAGVGDDHQSA